MVKNNDETQQQYSQRLKQANEYQKQRAQKTEADIKKLDKKIENSNSENERIRLKKTRNILKNRLSTQKQQILDYYELPQFKRAEQFVNQE